jgi:hypothetical protein
MLRFSFSVDFVSVANCILNDKSYFIFWRSEFNPDLFFIEGEFILFGQGNLPSGIWRLYPIWHPIVTY